jgi:hypothetical protein
MYENKSDRVAYNPGCSQPPAFGIPTVRIQRCYCGIQLRLITGDFPVSQVARKFDVGVPLADADRTTKKSRYRLVLVI